jgi:hypothetical protein
VTTTGFRNFYSTDSEVLFIPFWYRVVTSNYFLIPSFLLLDLSIIGFILEIKRTAYANETVLELKKLVEIQETNVHLSKEILGKLQDLENEINGRGIFFRRRSRRRKAIKELSKLASQTMNQISEKGFDKLQVRGGASNYYNPNSSVETSEFFKKLLTTHTEESALQKELLITQKETKNITREVFKILHKFEEQRLKEKAALNKNKSSFKKITEVANKNLSNFKRKIFFFKKDNANPMEIRGGQEYTDDLLELMENSTHSMGQFDDSKKSVKGFIPMTRKAFCYIISTSKDLILCYGVRLPFSSRLIEAATWSKWQQISGGFTVLIHCIGESARPYIVALKFYTKCAAIAAIFLMNSNMLPFTSMTFKQINDSTLKYPMSTRSGNSQEFLLIGGSAEFQKYSKQVENFCYHELYRKFYPYRVPPKLEEIELLAFSTNKYQNVTDLINVKDLQSDTMLQADINEDLLHSYTQHIVTLKDTIDGDDKVFKKGDYGYDNIDDLVPNTEKREKDPEESYCQDSQQFKEPKQRIPEKKY